MVKCPQRLVSCFFLFGSLLFLPQTILSPCGLRGREARGIWEAGIWVTPGPWRVLSFKAFWEWFIGLWGKLRRNCQAFHHRPRSLLDLLDERPVEMRSCIDLELCLHLYPWSLAKTNGPPQRRSSLSLSLFSLSPLLSRSLFLFLFWTLFIFQFLSAAAAIPYQETSSANLSLYQTALDRRLPLKCNPRFIQKRLTKIPCSETSQNKCEVLRMMPFVPT